VDDFRGLPLLLILPGLNGVLMKKGILVIACALVATVSFAQSVQRSTNPNGVQIQGNTKIDAEQKNTAAIAVGEGNTAANTAGAIKGGTQIQGNTNIKASQTNAAAVAVGKNNTAKNETGVIGGK